MSYPKVCLNSHKGKEKLGPLARSNGGAPGGTGVATVRSGEIHPCVGQGQGKSGSGGVTSSVVAGADSSDHLPGLSPTSVYSPENPFA